MRRSSAIQGSSTQKSPDSQRRLVMSLHRECNRERRETREKKSTPSVERPTIHRRQRNEDAGRPFVLLVSFCSKLPGPHAEQTGSVAGPVTSDMKTKRASGVH